MVNTNEKGETLTCLFEVSVERLQVFGVLPVDVTGGVAEEAVHDVPETLVVLQQFWSYVFSE